MPTPSYRRSCTVAPLPNEELERLLEGMVDSRSLAAIVYLLSTICTEKADHIRTNWQDEALAKVWERNARKLAHVGDELYF